MTNEQFIQLMKKDLTRFAVKTKDDVMHKGEPAELTEALEWVRKPLTPHLINDHAKLYKMHPEEFEEYAHRFKTFYEGK